MVSEWIEAEEGSSENWVLEGTSHIGVRPSMNNGQMSVGVDMRLVF